MRWRNRASDVSRQARVVALNWRDPWHPEGGGSELYLHQVAQRLAADGCRVTVFSAQYSHAPRREYVDGLTYLRRGGRLTVYLWAALYLLTRRFGRVDSVLEVQNGMPFLARLFTRARVVVLVHHVHREQWPVVGPVLARVGWFMESRVAVRVNRGARYITVSDVTRDELAGLGVAREEIALAYNALLPRPEFAGRERSPGPRLVVLGRLVPHKQVEHAIAAVASLRSEFPDLHLDILGSGWWQEHLHASVHQHGVEDHVTFVGHVTDRAKFETLSRSWVHLMPSLKEGWGLSIIEAASVGVPSIAYRSAGGVQEAIQDGVTGLLADSPADFVESVRWLLADAGLCRSLGEKAEIRVEQFSWDVTTAVVRRALQV